MRPRIPKQTGSGPSRMVYTTDLTHKLNQLRVTSEEFTKATVEKSEAQFLAESCFIIDQVEDIRNQVKPEPYDIH